QSSALPLSYSHHVARGAGSTRSPRPALARMRMARPAGFEPATSSLEGWRSIQLSYGREVRIAVAANPDLFRPARSSWNRGERIRTSDLLRPRQARYQAALRPARSDGGVYSIFT